MNYIFTNPTGIYEIWENKNVINKNLVYNIEDI